MLGLPDAKVRSSETQFDQRLFDQNKVTSSSQSSVSSGYCRHFAFRASTVELWTTRPTIHTTKHGAVATMCSSISTDQVGFSHSLPCAKVATPKRQHFIGLKKPVALANRYRPRVQSNVISDMMSESCSLIGRCL